MNEAYWTLVRQKAAELGSDGCSYVRDWYKDCCLEHDVHYRTRKTVYGRPITRAQSDRRLRRCIQRRSPAGRRSPLAWARWTGTRVLGWWAWWRNKRKYPDST